MNAVYIGLILALLLSCAGSIAVDVIFGKQLHAAKCAPTDWKCWYKQALYIFFASICCLVATVLSIKLATKAFV